MKATIEAQAGDRKRNVLVQAVSLLRQRKLDDVVKSLNNLLACNKVRTGVESAAQHVMSGGNPHRGIVMFELSFGRFDVRLPRLLTVTVTVCLFDGLVISGVYLYRTSAVLHAALGG